MQCSGLRPSHTCNVFVLHDRANQLTNTFCVEQTIFFHLPTLESRSTKADLLTLYKIIHNHISLPLFRIIFSSRHTHRIIIRPVRLQLYRNSFFHRSFTEWNNYIKGHDLSHRGFSKLLSSITLTTDAAPETRTL